MKEKLIERLKEMTEAVQKKQAEVAQVNADYNVMLGHHQELSALVDAWDSLTKPETEKASKVDSDRTGEVI